MTNVIATEQPIFDVKSIVDQLKNVGTQVPCVVTPEDYRIHNLERYMENRATYRVSLKTDSIDDFINYSQKFEQDGATCFIATGTMSAKTVFDLGTKALPSHQLHNAKLTLKATAQYRALLNLSGSQLSQKEISHFIEDWDASIAVLPIKVKRLITQWLQCDCGI